ncbi:probable outer membrane protein pmp6 [Dysidea avara]|uniref:probable outer membrane protein pmp6 n=1 Tax=Dysidea avara TaxID=196820 RepID=UPI0033322255
MSVRLMFPLILFLLLEVDGVKRVMPDIDVYPRDVTEDDVGGSGSDEADEIPCCNLDIDSNDTEYDSSGSGGDEVDEIPCCNSGNYTFYSIVDALNSVTSNTIIKVSTDVVLPSNVMLEGLDNITIIGVGIPTVNCNDTGSVKFVSCNNVIIEGVNWEMCGSNKFPGIEFYDSSIISIQSCSFQHSRRQAVALSKVSGNVFINNCQFTHNKYHKGHGVAIYYTSSPEQSTQVQLVINNCNFSLNGPAKRFDGAIFKPKGFGGAIFSNRKSMILIDDKTIVTFRNNKAGKEGGAVYANQSTICTNGSSRVTFTNNDGDWHGYGGALSAINSDIFFHGNSAVTFNNNRANCGGAVYILYNVTMSFGENCTVTFTGNHAIDDFHGGAVFAVKSHITFHGYSKVIFSNNHAGSGGAIMLWDNSVITFNENSNITFLGNNAKHYAGAVFVRSKSVMSFNETSTVSFTKNAGQYGGSVFTDQCNIIFNGYSTVTFSRNYAMNGGVITMRSTMQPISFKEHCTVLFNNNRATDQGGALFSLLGSAGSVEFTGNSSVMFYNNRAETGGAVSANTVYQGNANVTFVHNRARYGGAIYISKTSYTTFTGNAIVDFCNNTASLNGGAISSLNNSNIWFTGRSTIYFNNNLARQHGGAISSVVNTRIAFDETCSVRFAGNKVTQQGGAIYLFDNSTITFKSTSDVTYNNNSTALQQDGTVFSALQSNTLFKGNSKNVTFVHNRARYGGAIYISKTSYTTFTGKSIVDFCNNTASLNGGAISSLDNSNIWFTGRSTIYFNNNLARQHGGAISSVINTRITFDETCSVRFAGNKVTQQGGAIYLFDKSTITFKSTSDVTYNNNNNNTALQQNGTVFSTLRSNTLFKGNSKNVTFVHNRARKSHC